MTESSMNRPPIERVLRVASGPVLIEFVLNPDHGSSRSYSSPNDARPVEAHGSVPSLLLAREERKGEEEEEERRRGKKTYATTKARRARITTWSK